MGVPRKQRHQHQGQQKGANGRHPTLMTRTANNHNPDDDPLTRGQPHPERQRCSHRRPSEIQILDAQRVFLNEGPPRFDHIAHQFGKDVVRLGQIIDLDLQQGACLGV